MKPLRFKMWEDSRREYKMKTHTSEYRAAVPIWSGEVTRELTVTQQIGVMWHVFKLLRTAVISTNSFPTHSSPPKSVYEVSHISWLFVSWIKDYGCFRTLVHKLCLAGVWREANSRTWPSLVESGWAGSFIGRVSSFFSASKHVYEMNAVNATINCFFIHLRDSW